VRGSHDLKINGRNRIVPCLPRDAGLASGNTRILWCAENEAEAMIQLDDVTDNLRGKTVTLVAGCWLFYTAQAAKHGIKYPRRKLRGIGVIKLTIPSMYNLERINPSARFF
jgi:hypothetical protein